MKKAILFGILIVILALAITACAPAAKPAPASDGNTTSVSTEEGKAIVEVKCAQCHTLDRVTSASKSEADWTKSVDRMIGKGLKLDAAEKQAVIAYLAETYK